MSLTTRIDHWRLRDSMWESRNLSWDFSPKFNQSPLCRKGRKPEFLTLKLESRFLGHSSNLVCGFSMMEQVRLCAVWPMENWLGSFLDQIQGCTTVKESYSCALEQGPLSTRVPDNGERENVPNPNIRSWVEGSIAHFLPEAIFFKASILLCKIFSNPDILWVINTR